MVSALNADFRGQFVWVECSVVCLHDGACRGSLDHGAVAGSWLHQDGTGKIDPRLWILGRVDRTLCPVLSYRIESSGKTLPSDFARKWAGWIVCAPSGIFLEHTLDVSRDSIDGGNLAIGGVLGDW